MREHNIKLVAVDLDGTLLNRRGTIDEPTAKAVRRAARQGIILVVSTGRPMSEIPERELNDLGISYIVALNGAAIYQMPERKCIYKKPMEAESVARLMEKLGKLEVYPDLFSEHGEYGMGDREELLQRLSLPSDIREFIRTHSVFVPALPEFIRRKKLEILKISVSFIHTRDGYVIDHQEAEEVMEDFPGLTVVSGGGDNMEITDKNVTKGEGLALLLQKEGIPWDQVMAIGDSQNDLDSISKASIGIAMANSSDELKKQADFVVSSNADNGVAEALTLFALNEIEEEDEDMSFLELAKERYSCRKFADRLVEPEKIDQILEAAIVAPTAKNFQPVHLWVLSSGKSIEKVNEVTRCIYGASTVIAVGCTKDGAYVRSDGKNYADVDATIVATHVMMEAQDLGLNTTFVGWFDEPKLHELFPEMDGYDIIALFPVGYASEEAAGQPSPRHSERKSREELVTEL